MKDKKKKSREKILSIWRSGDGDYVGFLPPEAWAGYVTRVEADDVGTLLVQKRYDPANDHVEAVWLISGIGANSGPVHRISIFTASLSFVFAVNNDTMGAGTAARVTAAYKAFLKQASEDEKLDAGPVEDVVGESSSAMADERRAEEPAEDKSSVEVDARTLAIVQGAMERERERGR